MQQEQSLYRESAWQALAMQKHGRALLLPSLSAWAISGFILFWLILLAIILIRHSFTEKTTVLGYVSSRSPSLAIQAKEPAGSVHQILVKNGEFVQKGQHLLTIKRSNAVMLGDDELKNQLQFLKHHQSLLHTNKQARIADLKQQQGFIQQQLTALERESDALQAQATLIAERIEIGEQDMQGLQTLFSKGMISQDGVNQAKQTHLSLQQQSVQIAQQVASAASQRSQLEAKIASLAQQIIAQNTETQLSQLPVEQRFAELDASQSYNIMAPRDGVVSNLLLQVGDDVSRFPVLLKLSDAKAELFLSLAVPASAAGFVNATQNIRVRLDAFPHQKYGTINATVAKVSKTLTLPHEGNNHPVPIQQPVFFVDATLSQEHILAKGEAIPLKEGMTVQADVILSERSLLEWLLSPLYSMRGSL